MCVEGLKVALVERARRRVGGGAADEGAVVARRPALERSLHGLREEEEHADDMAGLLEGLDS